jgi:hypothetical protein
MSKRRIGPKIKPTSKRTVQDFEKAVRQHELLGSTPPEMWEQIKERYFETRFALYELIQQLEAQPVPLVNQKDFIAIGKKLYETAE